MIVIITISCYRHGIGRRENASQYLTNDLLWPQTFAYKSTSTLSHLTEHKLQKQDTPQKNNEKRSDTYTPHIIETWQSTEVLRLFWVKTTRWIPQGANEQVASASMSAIPGLSARIAPRPLWWSWGSQPWVPWRSSMFVGGGWRCAGLVLDYVLTLSWFLGTEDFIYIYIKYYTSIVEYWNTILYYTPILYSISDFVKQVGVPGTVRQLVLPL